MKNWLLMAACASAAIRPFAWGILPPAQPPLPNYDKRPSLSATPTETEARERALARLRERLPGVTVDRDRVLGSPAFITTPRGFLTPPAGEREVAAAAVGTSPANDPYRVIKAFVDGHADLFGHTSEVLASARISRDYVTAHNGLRTVIWEQTVDDIPVFEALLTGHVTKRGELVNVSSRFLPDGRRAADAGTPNRAALLAAPFLNAADAIARAAANLGTVMDASAVARQGEAVGAEKLGSFTSDELRGETRAKLVWLPVSRDLLRLCWRVELTTKSRSELYALIVDAQTGEPWVRHCLTAYLMDATYNVFTSDSPSPFSPGWPAPNNGQPPLAQRKMVTFSALFTNASPDGWIPDTGSTTVGNNVDAHLDRNADERPDLPRISVTNRVFDFPLDLTRDPSTYGDASVVQLFYWCNWMHDQLYQLGFTEAAGNFQTDNFRRGGIGNDAVQADAQDGINTGNADNAFFSTPPDGGAGRMQMYIWTGPNPRRDGSLDAEVVLHEYTHGLSSRLVGGGVGISALQPSGMGEGWSDFYALSLLGEASDDVHGTFAQAAYSINQFSGLQANYYFGIRRYPYTTDIDKNPLTFKDIDPTQADPHAGIPISSVVGGGSADETHNMGEVWCVTLWDARANIIDKLGFEEGNQTILRLVTDGMKLAPANPTFLQARDAILKADEVNSGGDNRTELWLAFGKRGMGVNATVPRSDTTVGVVEDFEVPPDVIETPADGVLELTVTPRSGSTLLAGARESIFVRVIDGAPVTNATIAATANGVPGPTFRNNGVEPDKAANNAVYSATLNVPTNTDTVTLVLVISAPGKETATNTVSYNVVPLPPNDYFTNALKVPVTGAVYFSNNKVATIETNEPTHAGVAAVAGSLWWSWSSSAATNVLVDTAGSAVDTVVAVYTGTNITRLTEIVSTNNVGSRRQAYVNFDAAAGTAYRIAVASLSTNSLGSLSVRIVPGLHADTNPPTVTVTGPPSGLIVISNRVLVTGSAVDPQPDPSGIDRILIRISRGLVTEEIVAGTDGPRSLLESTNWSQNVALVEGVNILSVSASDVAGNISPAVTLQVTYRPRDPINDLFANAIVLTNNSDVSSVNTLHATKESGEPSHANNTGGKSAWWSFTPTVDGTLSLSTTNSTFDTLLAVYQGTRVNALTPVAANDDAYTGSGFSTLSIAVRAGQTYRIAVDGFDGVAGAVFLSYTFTPGTVYTLTVNATAGGAVVPGSGPAAANSKVVLQATAEPNFDFMGWTGSVVASTNPLILTVTSDANVTAQFAPHAFTDGFESGGFTALPWTQGGNAPWVVQTNSAASGKFAARSGAITDGQSSVLRLTVTSPGGIGSFDYRVSSEPTWDTLGFYLNGTLLQTWSGEVNWAKYQFPMPAGSVNLEWRYTKDASQSAGLDAAFIDSFDLPSAVSTPASIRLTSQTAGAFQIQFEGLASQPYRIQASPDLTVWQTISTGSATASTIPFTDPQPATNQVRYYRVVSP